MAYGLRCWDADGNLTVDISNRLTRVVGTVVGSVSNRVSGTITIPTSIVAGGTVFAFSTGTAYISGWNLTSAIESIQVSGNTITYSELTGTMIYGVY